MTKASTDSGRPEPVGAKVQRLYPREDTHCWGTGSHGPVVLTTTLHLSKTGQRSRHTVHTQQDHNMEDMAASPNTEI